MKRRDFIMTASAASVGVVSQNSFARKLTPILGSLPTFTFARIRYASGNWDTDEHLPSVLYRSLSRYTSLRTEKKEHIVGLDSDELFAFPFAYLTGNSVVAFSGRERENLLRFIYDGGFVFVDDCNHDIKGSFAVSFENEISTLLGGHEHLERLPSDDDLYRAYFDFSSGPPATRQELNAWGDRQVHDYLKSIVIKDRMAVLYSNKDYGCEWNEAYRSPSPELEESTKFGVNIVVYALTVRNTALQESDNGSLKGLILRERDQIRDQF